jgi:methylmalonyl-CoA/ethylmalonyl-CoA epimerase
MATIPFEGLSRIAQINIPVHDLETSVELYRHSLGMIFLFQVPNMAFFDCEGIRILLAEPEDEAFDDPSSIIYFKVEDIHSATNALHDRGVSISRNPELIAEMPDHDLWMSFFKDPSGNTLALMSEVARPDRTEQSA